MTQDTPQDDERIKAVSVTGDQVMDSLARQLDMTRAELSAAYREAGQDRQRLAELLGLDRDELTAAMEASMNRIFDEHGATP